MSKTIIGVLFGGRSGEHEVSRNSAFSVATALSHTYEIFPIGIAKDGRWFGPVPLEEIKSFTAENFADKEVTIIPNPISQGTVYNLPRMKPLIKVDVFFPVLHGTNGEDGTVQGLLELANVPYAGSGVLASATGMDKIVMKMLFAQAGLPQVKFLGFLRSELQHNPEELIRQIEEELGYPCFVKPANLGSSVGISKAAERTGLLTALNNAARYDRKIIVEKGVSAREIEVSILGNDAPEASLPGEIVPCNEFYDYKAKYIDDRSALIIPAELPKETQKKLQELAIAAYKVLGCSGLSRVDFFLTKDNGEVLINEINTLPGFTSISMYPKLWEHSGLPMDRLVSKLVELALERHQDKELNLFTYDKD